MISPDKVLRIALDEEGYLEKSKAAYTINKNIIYEKVSGAGQDNVTKYGKEMHDVYPKTMDFPAAWCDAFVDWCMYKAYGFEMAQEILCGTFDDYTINSSNFYKKANRWKTKLPVPGDQIFFKNSTKICHTGLVYKVDRRYVYTIEGNTNNKGILVPNGGGVFKKKYLLSYAGIAGYGCPRYDVRATCTLGDENEDVAYLQKRLMAKGYTLSKYGVDGSFGGETLTALKEFRVDSGLKSSTMCDADCWEALER